MPVMGFVKFERFFRAAGGVTVDRDDVKRYLDFVNDARYDLLVMGAGHKPASLGATGGPAAAQTIEGGWRPGGPGMRNMIAAFDRAAVRRIGETDSRLLDLVMPRLSRLANRGLLWIVLASVLRAT